MGTNSLKALLEQMDECDVELDSSGMVRVSNQYLDRAIQSITWEQIGLVPGTNISCSTVNNSNCH